MRPGIQSLLTAAMNGEFDIVLTEALDRLSRNQADIAAIYERLEFAGVKIVTLSEGEISTLHIGLKGTMNAMFLKDLADKTRRGLRGNVERGKSGGGLPYGYKVTKQFTSEGEAIRGDREVDEEQAGVVRRIFAEYAYKNRSPKVIAIGLNNDGIPGPAGKAWGPSTLSGNRKRGTGILNNQLYVGELIWNRLRMVKDPSTGRRVSRVNPESEWVRTAVPQLRIVSQELWDAAKARQKDLDRFAGKPYKQTRPQYLLSGLIKCGECGGGFSKISSAHYGCSTARNKGKSICSHRKTVRRDFLESRVLNALETHLLCEDAVAAFCEEYARNERERVRAYNQSVRSGNAEKERLTKERERLVAAIRNGIDASLIKDDLERVARQLDDLEKQLNTADDVYRPLIHPAMAMSYRTSVASLKAALDRADGREEAVQHIRALIDKVVVTPVEGREDPRIDLYGHLAGILSIASKKAGQLPRRPWIPAGDKNPEPEQTDMVAGAGFEPATFGL